MSGQVFNLGYDNFLGRMAIARIYSGKIVSGSTILVKGEYTELEKVKLTKTFYF
jgi:GTP-binding protein